MFLIMVLRRKFDNVVIINKHAIQILIPNK